MGQTSRRRTVESWECGEGPVSMGAVAVAMIMHGRLIVVNGDTQGNAES